MTEQEDAQPECVGNQHGFVVVPSTVYNNKVLEILKDVASSKAGDMNLVVQVEKSFIRTEYLIVEMQEPKSHGLNPFASVSSERVWASKYSTDFGDIRRKSTDTPFYGVPQQQVFFSEADYKKHFELIRKSTEEFLDRVIANSKEEEENDEGAS